MTTVVDRGRSLDAVSITYSIIGTPAMGWTTFGRADFMRVPLPAARTTTWTSVMDLIIALILSGRAGGGSPRAGGMRVPRRPQRGTRRLRGGARDRGRAWRARGSRGSARSRVRDARPLEHVRRVAYAPPP